MRSVDKSRAFTLIELLVVVAIIGIIASILIPNLLDALHKARQKRTMSDMRNVGTSWMSWLTDQVGAASAGSAKIYRAGDFRPLKYEALLSYLQPSGTFFYMQEVPRRDRWGGTYLYGMSLNPATDFGVTIMCSTGRDMQPDTDCLEDWTSEPFVTTDYDQDIVWADGYFVRWPG